MDQIFDAWMNLGAWRWLALAAILFAAELATGTAYLLWLSAAAVATALVIALPGEINVAVELLLFGIFSIASTLFGKRFFKPNLIKSDQPELNLPNRYHIGSRATVVIDFAGGEGRVALGDTQWTARTLDGTSPKQGAIMSVVSVDGTILHVQTAD